MKIQMVFLGFLALSTTCLAAAGPIEVQGRAPLGTQCYGQTDSIKPLKVQLWRRSGEGVEVQFASNVGPRLFRVNCQTRTIALRAEDLPPVDSEWQIQSDGTFRFEMPLSSVRFLVDESRSCSATVKARFDGKVDCNDPGHPVIDVEEIMKLGTAHDDSNSCHFGQGAYLYTATRLNQCRSLP